MVRRTSGIKDFHPHRCRHTYAMRWLAAGGSLAVLQELLGHAELTTTSRYAKVTPRISTARACLPYQGNGYHLFKRVTASRWRKIFVGSDLPPCTLRVPPDLIRCVNAP